MTADRDLELQLGPWFVEHSVSNPPEGLLDRSLGQVGATRQRPGWLVRDRGRAPLASGHRAPVPARAGRLLAAAVAVLVIVAGFGLLLRLSPALISGPPSPPPVAPAPSTSEAPSSSPSSSPAAAATPVPTATPGPGGLIAFVRTTDKVGTRCYDPNPTCPVSRVWVVSPDGSGAHELAPQGVGPQGDVAWSPDGARLVISSWPKLYLTDVNGDGPQVADTGCVAPCTGDNSAAFSRDGTKIVFVRSVTGSDDGSLIATMDLSSGRVVELRSTFPLGGSRPAWSPDGTRIVFSRYTGKGPKAATFIVDADGQNLHRVTPANQSLGLADWSPDGERILLTSFDKPDPAVQGDFHQDIYTIRPDGSDLRRLTTDGISNRATWTPDGRILFARGIGFVPDGGSPGLWTMDADGSDAARRMPSPMKGDEWQWVLPAWQPVGGPATPPLPWHPQLSTSVGPPPPTPAPTPTPPLGPGFSWTGSMHLSADGPLGGTATLLADGRVLVTGGCTTDVELYDPVTGRFTTTGSLAAIRGSATATLLRDGRVLIAGGTNCGIGGQDAIGASAELYDPATGVFAPTGSMGTPRASHTATLLADGRVLIAGGQTMPAAQGAGSVRLASYRTAATGSSDILATAEIYDPTTGSFSPTGSMRDFRHRFTATLLQDGRVLVVGGGGEGYPSRTSAEVYDPTAGRFAPTGSLQHGRYLQTATLLQDGRVLVAGGRSPDGITETSAEVFDPATGTFSPTGPMAMGRQAHTATRLLDGRVLIAGGDAQEDASAAGQSLARTELYDPGTGTFTLIGSMGDQRESHTATLLRDGRVLIAGGFDIGGDATGAVTSAVLYQP